MAKSSPMEYVRQVKAEMRKTTWPGKSELVSGTIAVFIMVTIAAIFLFLADQALSWIVRSILSIGA